MNDFDLPPPKDAYDLVVLGRDYDPAQADKGWCFGLPRGLSTAQWPLDPLLGYPLQHGFTLRLPEQYQVRGPGYPAISFFATAPDNLSVPDWTQLDPAIITDPAYSEPANLDERAFWEAAQSRHPTTHWMKDVIGYWYALLFLTEEEFAGPQTTPPATITNSINRHVTAPLWLSKGSMVGFFGDAPVTIDDTLITPRPGLSSNLAVRWSPRAADPNAGVASGAPDYVKPYELDLTGEAALNVRYHEWSEDHAFNHIGGTMRPAQQIPDMSPFYIGFEEDFGGYNFGGGNAQLDFRALKFDWAQ